MTITRLSFLALFHHSVSSKILLFALTYLGNYTYNIRVLCINSDLILLQWLCLLHLINIVTRCAAAIGLGEFRSIACYRPLLVYSTGMGPMHICSSLPCMAHRFQVMTICLHVFLYRECITWFLRMQAFVLVFIDLFLLEWQMNHGNRGHHYIHVSVTSAVISVYLHVDAKVYIFILIMWTYLRENFVFQIILRENII